jgi:hypothetical protein
MKRDTNSISKHAENNFDVGKNLIKRDTDYEDIEKFLDEKFHEINKNDASEEFSDEEETFIQKRSSIDLRNSIRKLENAIDVNEFLVRNLLEIGEESEETAKLISKDLDDAVTEIKSLDEDIVDILETAKSADNSIHKRIRHKRETDFFSPADVDPVALQIFGPILEQKKREKRLVQEKLAEVRDEFIRCKKSANGENHPTDCDAIYHQVLDRFREITKKFKEIEVIIEKMEEFHGKSNDSNEEKKKKKDKKKKKKKVKNSSESNESSEEFKKKKSTTAAPEDVTTIVNEDFQPTTENEIETSTSDEFETTTMTIFDENSEENFISRDQKVPKMRDTIVQPLNLRDFGDDPSLQMATTETCPASAFNDDILGHPSFQEDLNDPHSGMKFFQNHHSVDHFVDQKIQRSQRGPISDMISPIIEDFQEIADEGRNMFEDMIDNGQNGESNLEKSQKSSTTDKNNVGASGPFIALCEQMSKAKQAQQQPQVFEQPQQQHFVPVPLSAFANPAAMQFPTMETMKGSAKVMMNPGFNMMQYPVCFMHYPQYRLPQQQLYYPGLIPGITQPGGKVVEPNDDTIDPEFIRKSSQSLFLMNRIIKKNFCLQASTCLQLFQGSFVQCQFQLQILNNLLTEQMIP